MKFRFNCNKKNQMKPTDAADFSDGSYECRFLLQTMQGKPVAIMQKNDIDCDIWKVQYGFSTVFFGTYSDAMNFCRDRFCDLSGKKLSERGGD